MGWLDHGGLGFNYRLSDLAAALGVAQVEKLDALLERRAAVAALYARAPGGDRGRRGADRRRAAPERRSWFVYAVRLADGVDRDATIARLAERGIASKAYLPCIHLFPHLRELGYREGQFPVAEAAVGALAGAAVLPRDDRGPGRPRLRGARRRARPGPSHGIIARSMSRFRKDPDPRFWRLNRSIEFDWRLAAYDIDQSRAHARGLQRIGVLDDGGAGADRRRPRPGPARMASTASSSRTPTRTSTWRSSACSARRSGRSPASSTPAARATTRSRPTSRWSSRSHSLRAIELCGAAMERLLEPRRGPPRLADARLHPPAARPAGLPRPPPARLLLDARPRRAALPVRPRQRLRDAARLRRPGRRQLGDRPRRGRRRPRLRARHPQLDRRRLQPRLRPRLPRRGVDLRDAPLAARLGDRHLVEHRVRLLRARRVLLLGLQHHAAEEEPRLGRAAARQEPAGRRRLRDAARRRCTPCR